ncbi:MAG: hypothetical protein WAS49_05895 [Candidatus Dechloromonas phosphoritropha]|jgi:hypothetical protein|nr:hypothetical protein [Candidatus Dechloromonas phosphoritropha]MBP8786227.1 hypothetical protein [Azonexus sp.]MBP9226593.1 hypothetical protein [Azonexus sp.]
MDNSLNQNLGIHPQATQSSPLGNGAGALVIDNRSAVSWQWEHDDRVQRMQLRRAGEVSCADVVVPVWSLADESEGLPRCEGKFVRYCDIPAELLGAFREQQLLAGRPFSGAAFVEDFQFFADILAHNW